MIPGVEHAASACRYDGSARGSICSNPGVRNGRFHAVCLPGCLDAETINFDHGLAPYKSKAKASPAESRLSQLSRAAGLRA